MKNTIKIGTATALVVACTALLGARNAALQKIILVECENEKEKGNIRAMLLMLLREAAGAGFDEGVRFMASNDKVRHGGTDENP